MHRDKDHQVLFVGGLNTHKSKMTDGGQKSEKSPYFSNDWTDRHEIWHDDAY